MGYVEGHERARVAPRWISEGKHTATRKPHCFLRLQVVHPHFAADISQHEVHGVVAHDRPAVSALYRAALAQGRKRISGSVPKDECPSVLSAREYPTSAVGNLPGVRPLPRIRRYGGVKKCHQLLIDTGVECDEPPAAGLPRLWIRRQNAQFVWQ